MPIQLSADQIKEIAEQLDCGFRCFINRQDTNLIFIPDTNKLLSIDTEAWESEINELDNHVGDYLEIEPIGSSDSFLFMEEFIATLDDSNTIKERLRNSINKKKPFMHFKFAIDNSGEFRQKWFDFKKTRIQDWVIARLEDEI